jgi:hypothetical protein
MADDPRRDAARYRLERDARERGEEPEAPRPSGPSMEQRGWIAETAIQQAQRRGDFDDLPGAGKPLTGLRDIHDPDWWIRRKIEREQLTGLGPPALTLRVESAALPGRLDALFREDEVRAVVEDFNARVIEARRQLLGGPPVVTPTRDVEDEVRAWRERRAAQATPPEPSGPPQRRRRRPSKREDG